jgi:hypothetical protein
MKASVIQATLYAFRQDTRLHSTAGTNYSPALLVTMYKAVIGEAWHLLRSSWHTRTALYLIQIIYCIASTCYIYGLEQLRWRSTSLRNGLSGVGTQAGQ